jgi:hypothetical protein
MAVTELTYSQLLLQGSVGEDHHLWRSGGSGQEGKGREQWRKASREAQGVLKAEMSTPFWFSPFS